MAKCLSSLAATTNKQKLKDWHAISANQYIAYMRMNENSDRDSMANRHSLTALVFI